MKHLVTKWGRKIRKYRADYNTNPPNTVSFMAPIRSTSGRLHSEFVRLLFLRFIGKLTTFFTSSGVQFPESDRGQYHFRRTVFTQQVKHRVVLTLGKVTTLRITLNLDGEPIISKSHTHPSHSQIYRLLTSSLSLGVLVPRATQCMWDM
jgi:hypothetical protein